MPGWIKRPTRSIVKAGEDFSFNLRHGHLL
jgi:hypothetical protein